MIARKSWRSAKWNVKSSQPGRDKREKSKADVETDQDDVLYCDDEIDVTTREGGKRSDFEDTGCLM